MLVACCCANRKNKSKLFFLGSHQFASMPKLINILLDKAASNQISCTSEVFASMWVETVQKDNKPGLGALESSRNMSAPKILLLAGHRR